jgi:molecular chaperone IbpA
MSRKNVLSVQGKRDPEPDEVQYLYQGIAGRSFERHFQLEENVEVRGARLESGLLHVDLERIVPEEKKPRRIAARAAIPAAQGDDSLPCPCAREVGMSGPSYSGEP